MDAQLVVELVEVEHESMRMFKELTNKVVGRGLQIPEDNLVFFGYRVSHNGAIKLLVSAGTLRPATESQVGHTKSTDVSSQTEAQPTLKDECLDPSEAKPFSEENFLDSGSHVIEYLFTDVYYRRQGYGAQVLDFMINKCKELNHNALIKLWAAKKARHFFQKRGFRLLSEVPSKSEDTRTVDIFKELYAMEKDLNAVPKPKNPQRRWRRGKPFTQQKPSHRPTFGPA